MQVFRSKFSRNLVAIIASIITPLFMLIAIYSLNRLLVSVEEKSSLSSTSFQVTQQAPKKTTQRIKPKPKARKAPPKQNIAPNLDAILGGSSFGIAALEWLDRDSLSKDLLEDMKNAAMTADTVDDPPVVEKTAPLEYPNYARKKGIAGHVIVNLLITPGGRVEKSQIVESFPSGVFDDVALNSVKQWQFKPGMDKGKRVAVWVEQKISFALN